MGNRALLLAPAVRGLPSVGVTLAIAAAAVMNGSAAQAQAGAEADPLAQRRACDAAAALQATPHGTTSLRSDPGVAEIERALREADCARPRQRSAPQARVITVQERDRPDYRPTGLHLGGFTLFPQAGATVQAESNVFRTSVPAADIALLTDVNFRLQSNWSRHALQLEAAAQNRTYASYSSENTTDYDISATARADVYRRSTLTALVSHGRARIERGAAGEIQRTLEPVRYDYTVGELRAAYPGTRIGGELSLRYSTRDYDDSQDLSGAAISEQYRNFTRATLSARVDYNGKPGSAIYLLFKQDWVDLHQDFPFNRDRKISTILLGYRGEVTPLIRVRAAAGLLTYAYDDPALRHTTRPSFDVQADWTVTNLTTVRLAARRDVAESLDRAAAVETRTLFSLGADHELLRNLILSADLEYQISDFAEQDGSDTRWRQTLGARWLINRNLTATLQVRGEQRRYASRPAFDFDNYLLRAGVRYAF